MRGVEWKQMSRVRNVRQWKGLRTTGELVNTQRRKGAWSSADDEWLGRRRRNTFVQFKILRSILTVLSLTKVGFDPRTYGFENKFIILCSIQNVDFQQYLRNIHSTVTFCYKMT